MLFAVRNVHGPGVSPTRLATSAKLSFARKPVSARAPEAASSPNHKGVMNSRPSSNSCEWPCYPTYSPLKHLRKQKKKLEAQVACDLPSPVSFQLGSCLAHVLLARCSRLSAGASHGPWQCRWRQSCYAADALPSLTYRDTQLECVRVCVHTYDIYIYIYIIHTYKHL